MIGKIFNNPIFQAVDSEGIPISGGLVYAYAPGTTTPKSTYTDRACTVADTWPIVLDANGQAVIYLLGATKINITDGEGVQQDNFPVDYLQGFDETFRDYYYPDSSAVDQGVTGSNNTIKYIVDSIGSNEATIHFRHNSGDATTPYVITTDLTISDNIHFIFDIGATLGGTGTLTMDHYLDMPLCQIFGDDLTVIGLKGTTYPEWFATNTTPGTTDMTGGIQTAINALFYSGGGNVIFQPTDYAFTNIELKPSVSLIGKSYGTSIPEVYLGSRLLQSTAAIITTPALQFEGTSTRATRSGGVWLEKIQVKNQSGSIVNVGVLFDKTHRCTLRDVRITGFGTDLKFNNSFDINLSQIRLDDSYVSGLTVEDSTSGDPSNNLNCFDLLIEGFRSGDAIIIKGLDSSSYVNKLYFYKLKVETVQSSFDGSEYVWMQRCRDIHFLGTDLSTVSGTGSDDTATFNAAFSYMSLEGDCAGIYADDLVLNDNNATTTAPYNSVIKTTNGGGGVGTNKGIYLGLGLVVAGSLPTNGLMNIASGTTQQVKINLKYIRPVWEDLKYSDFFTETGVLEDAIVQGFSLDVVPAETVVYDQNLKVAREAEAAFIAQNTGATGDNLWYIGRIKTDGSNTKFRIMRDETVWLNCNDDGNVILENGNLGVKTFVSPSGDFSNTASSAMPVYDEAGDLKGYIPIFDAIW